MREMTYAEAAVEGIREEMLKDSTIFMLGEDVGRFGGVYGQTKGLWEEFGNEVIRDTPISESAIIGFGIGAALNGMRPISEIMFCDLLALAMDQIVNQAAKIRYLSGGKIRLPFVIRVSLGGGRCAAAQHSQHLEAWFMHVPGLRIIIPSTPYDIKGLLKAAIREDNPVISFEHQQLYKTRGPVPEEEYTIPLGKADIKRGGKDITIVATSLMVQISLAAAEKLASLGIDAEVIDLRSLSPLDKGTIIESVKKTGRLAIVHQACLTGGVGAEIATVVFEEAFDYLDGPVKRISGLDVPVSFSPVLENFVIPTEERIIKEVKGVFK